jgi:hypothetical protein
MKFRVSRASHLQQPPDGCQISDTGEWTVELADLGALKTFAQSCKSELVIDFDDDCSTIVVYDGYLE